MKRKGTNKQQLDDLIEEAVQKEIQKKEDVVDEEEPFSGPVLDDISLEERLAGSQFAKEMNNKMNALAESIIQLSSQNQQLIDIISNQQGAEPKQINKEQQTLKSPAGDEPKPSVLDKLFAIMRELKESIQGFAYIAQRSESAKTAPTSTEAESIESIYRRGEAWMKMVDNVKNRKEEEIRKEVERKYLMELMMESMQKKESMLDARLEEIKTILENLKSKGIREPELTEIKVSESPKDITTGMIEHLN